ncbi:MAG: FAD:protein FMN transferase, partial [Planctomycetota bacterium]
MPESKNFITTLEKPAMATKFLVQLPGRSSPHAEAALDALNLVDSIEQRLSVYRESSEVSVVNRDAAQGPVPVSRDTFHLLKIARNISEQCGGAFDVSAGTLVDCWGFSRRSGVVPSADSIQDAMQSVGWRNLDLDAENQTVQFRRPGMRLNLGAIGKGFAVDKIAQFLIESGVQDFLVAGGNSSIRALGNDREDASDSPGSSDTSGDPAPCPDDEMDRGVSHGWWIGIQHPLLPQHRIGGIRLINAALATSGSGKQFFHHRGKRLGHVLDPRTGWPSGECLSLTLRLESTAAEGFPATRADAIATALYVDS